MILGATQYPTLAQTCMAGPFGGPQGFRLVTILLGWCLKVGDTDDQQCFSWVKPCHVLENSWPIAFRVKTAMLAFLALSYYILKSLYSQPAEV